MAGYALKERENGETMKLFAERLELLCWDNEGGDGDGGEGGDGDGTGAGTTTTTTTKQKTGDKTFTQDEVNKFVAERNKALKAKYEQMETDYQELLQQQNLTDGQRRKLEDSLERVRQEMMTKEQRLESEKKKAQAEFDTKLKAAQEEAGKYKDLFESTSIARAITDAASTAEAFNPKLFIAHLAPKSKMVEELDAEGNPTGELVPRVEWTSVDEEGKKHVSMKTPEEAVKLMKENVVEFGGLFKANVAAGIGAGTAPGQVSSAGNVDHAKISTDDYMKLASTPEGRKKLGLSR